MCESSRPKGLPSKAEEGSSKRAEGFAWMPIGWQAKKRTIVSSCAQGDKKEPLMATYRVNKMFPIAANMCAVVFVALLYCVYSITPIEEWEYLPDSERTVALVAFAVSAMSSLTVFISFMCWQHEFGKVSGIVYAGLVVMLISVTTNGILAFAPTVVKVDATINTRVFLVRWCEWIPTAGLMTFLCDAVDVPRSKEAMRKAVIYSLCQSISCIFGLVFPFCPGVLSWCTAMVFSVAFYLPIFPRLRFKFRIFHATPKGNSFSEMERYNRHRYSYELMLLCSIVWTFLVFAYFVNALVHCILPEDHAFRPYSLAMYVDCTFDVLAKALYMRQIVDTHKAVFQSEGLAQRQLVDLRTLMSALWGSSSDMIVLSIQHELKCLTLFSPGLSGILKGCQEDAAHEDSSQQMALVLELERDFENVFDYQDDFKSYALGRIKQAYHIDATEVCFDTFHEASIDDHVDPQSFAVQIAANLVKEAWRSGKAPTKTSSSLVPYDFQRPDGSQCNCEMRVLPHAENGMIAVVRDVSERFRRFEAERKAEAEALRRQKESQSQTRFVRHEVKNGLLAGIELIDNIRNALDEVEKGKNPVDQIRLSIDSLSDIEKRSTCWRRLSELDNNLHQVLDTVLAEAMARDVINEVYKPRYECVDVLANLRSASSNSERFPVRSRQADMPFLKLDQQLLHYIYRNAVSNACKYGKQGELVVTLVGYDKETMELEVQVINSPGPGHEELVGLGPQASQAVFEQGLRLHENLRIKDRFISHGDGAWIAQKCAKAMGGNCSIRFEDDLTIFSFKCPTEPLVPAVKIDTTNFVVPPDTFGVAVDDSKIQRKLMSRLLGLVGVAEENMTITGEKTSDIFGIEKLILKLLDSHPTAKILVIIDENLDYGGTGEEVVIMSGSKVMKDILTALPPEDERRILALIRSANDSTSDLAIYVSRAHGFFPKAPMTQDRLREMMAPLWAERFY
mmetsp:Transcript_126436/g.354044  ORF Transcript_126436/g.354044 Transcript_126436/m.354044 type:complete len:962 (+) Transcript_126436:88-2973(+)